MIYQLQFLSCPAKLYAEKSIDDVEKQLYTSRQHAEESQKYWRIEFQWEFTIIERPGL